MVGGIRIRIRRRHRKGKKKKKKKNNNHDNNNNNNHDDDGDDDDDDNDNENDNDNNKDNDNVHDEGFHKMQVLARAHTHKRKTTTTEGKRTGENAKHASHFLFFHGICDAGYLAVPKQWYLHCFRTCTAPPPYRLGCLKQCFNAIFKTHWCNEILQCNLNPNMNAVY